MRDERHVVVTGVGMLTPLEEDPAALHGMLLIGARALRPAASFDLPDLPGVQAAGLDGQGPERHLEGRNLRPLDRTGRLTAAAAALALADSGLATDVEGRPTPDIGLVLGTMFGSLRTISEFDRRGLTAGPNYTKPMDFANSVLNAAAGQAAIWHHLTGANTTVAGGTTAGLQALASAADLVRGGRAQAVLAGGAEELCPETLTGFAQAGLLCRKGVLPVPFHARRGGFALGEGAALLVLEEERAARRRGARILGRIAGSGNAFDPSRGRDEAAAMWAVSRAISRALEEAGIRPEEVDGLSVSASGLPEIDRREALGIAAALGERAARLPVTAVKGALGESLGAAGALQTVVLLEAMAAGALPGIAGLDDPDAALPLARAGSEPHWGALRRGLVTTIGLDGNACALVVSQERHESPRDRTP